MNTDTSRERVKRLAAKGRTRIETMLRNGQRERAIDDLAQVASRRNMECAFAAREQAEAEVRRIESDMTR